MSKHTSKQIRSRSVFSFWHCVRPYASRDEDLKIACHTAHIVALGHAGGGEDCLTLNNSDTSRLYQPLLKVAESTFQLPVFLKKKNKKLNPLDVPVS